MKTALNFIARLFVLFYVIAPDSLGQPGAGSCWHGIGAGCGATGGIGFFGWILALFFVAVIVLAVIWVVKQTRK